MRDCPECEMTLAEGHASCPGCGAQVRESTADCAACGEPLASGASSCPYCGQLLVDMACERHADRAAIGRCVLCSRAVCEACAVEGRALHLCPDHAEVPMIEGWAEVLSLADDIEAKLIEGNLRAEGVDARVLSQKDHFAIPVEFGDLARVRVLVRSHAFARAKQILAAHRDEHGEVSFGCPHCGRPYGEGETACAACGEALV